MRAQVNALLLDAIAEVDVRGLANRRGCSSTRAWLRSAHRIAPHEAAKLVSTAKALRIELPAVGTALRAGTVSLAQADVIVTAIGDLPAQTPVACKPHAEATMIEAAATFDPMILTESAVGWQRSSTPKASRTATKNPSWTRRPTPTGIGL